MKLPVHRIIPFSNVEGVGNRTSIFVQGCNANCLYCHNSETIPMKAEDVTLYTIDELLDVITHQIPYIRGITISGGESTLHHAFITKLFQEVKQFGLTCYIDTNGFFSYDQIESLIQETDKFLYDIKGLDKGLSELVFSLNLLDVVHLAKNAKQRFEKQSEHVSNLKKLLVLDKVEEVRLVYVKKYYDYQQVVNEIYDLLQDYPNVIFKVIKMHTRGLPKDRLLLLKGAVPTVRDFQEVKDYVNSLHFKNKIVFID